MKTCRKGHEREDNQIRCSICRKEYHKNYYLANTDSCKERQQVRYLANIEAIKKYKQEYYKDNKDDINAYRRAYRVDRFATDPLYKLTSAIRSLVRNAFLKEGWKENTKTGRVLGCDFNTLKEHLIKTAITNYGVFTEGQEYHIDHIIPLAAATTEKELIILSHYSNLQYLTPAHNINKSDNLNWKPGKET